MSLAAADMPVSEAPAQADGGDDDAETPVGLERFRSLERRTVNKDLNPVEIAPDLTALVAQPGDSETPWVSEVRSELLDYDGIRSVSVEPVGTADTALHLWLTEPRPAWLSVPQISSDVSEIVVRTISGEESLLAPQVTVGGRALADELIRRSFSGSIRWLALFALLAAGALGWRMEWRRGLLAAVALVGSVYFGSQVALRSVGEFDGTLATSPLIGAVAGLALGLIVCLRVVRWYRSSVEGDEADLIRRSLMEVANDISLVLGGVVLVIGVLWIGGALVRPLAGVVIGGLVGASFSAAVFGPGMAVLHRSHPVADNTLDINLPDGRQLVSLSVVGLLAITVVLAAFMFRTPGVDLLDHRALDDGSAAHAVGSRLGGGPGDPTDAVVVTGSSESIEAWSRAAASLSDVAWVDTPSNRYSGAEVGPVDPVQSLASELHVGQRSEAFAVVVPSVPIRSVDGAGLLNDLETLGDGGLGITEGARSLDRGSTTLLVVTVLLFALVGGGAVMVDTENLGFATTSVILRLVGGAATVGIYQLLTSDAPAAESLTAFALISVIVGMFELEFLHDRLQRGLSLGSGLGQAATLTAGLMAAAGLVVAFGRTLGGGPNVGRFGLGLAVALVIEVAVGFIVLRPVLFGENAAYHTVARPFRSTLHAAQRPARGKPASIDDPYWRRLVTDLLIAEFGLQTDPEVSELDQVFLDGTPLFRQAAEQHQNLSAANLRVTGRAPQLRRVETFREGPSSMLSVTVDHPERHLVDHDGTVYGVRRSERRSTMLWLVSPEPGRYRIAESIELGSASLDDNDPDAASEKFPEVASVVG